ncbi:MAG: peptidase C39 family protein [Candidatus Thermoplasmatota archaeon]|nr:peptidase C39 family protein [Candidatus Thermoplasmatota archaeon]
MSSGAGNPGIIDVPYFQQTRTATCGPACLMMVMNYWDSSFDLSRKMEFRLWTQSYSLFLLGGTFQYELASTAAAYGFHPEISQKTGFSTEYPRFPQLATLIENMVSYKARRMNIPIHYGSENITVIRKALSENIPPIVFINLLPLLGENVLHWVVVTGLDEQLVHINDPYIPKGFLGKQKKNHPVPRDVFLKAMETQTGRIYRLPPCVVLIKP